MKYVDIKALKPGDILIRSESHEPCIIRDVIKETYGIFNHISIGKNATRFRFHGFDCYHPVMPKMFLSFYGKIMCIESEDKAAFSS